MYPSIGKKIRKYRKERGMTQEELAEKLDLSINYVGALERADHGHIVGTHHLDGPQG